MAFAIPSLFDKAVPFSVSGGVSLAIGAAVAGAAGSSMVGASAGIALSGCYCGKGGSIWERGGGRRRGFGGSGSRDLRGTTTGPAVCESSTPSGVVVLIGESAVRAVTFSGFLLEWGVWGRWFRGGWCGSVGASGTSVKGEFGRGDVKESFFQSFCS